MKIFTKISIILAAVVVLAACKYEEGPGISLRSKRDRVSNEWKFTEYMHDGADVLNTVVSDNPMMTKTIDGVEEKGQYILTIMRTGSYSLNFLMPGGHVLHVTKHDTALMDTNYLISTMASSFPSSMASIGNTGTWSFDKKHSNIQMNPDLSYDSISTQEETYSWEIVMLKEKQLKVKGKSNGEDFNMTFEPLNEENFWW